MECEAAGEVSPPARLVNGGSEGSQADGQQARGGTAG